MDPSPIQPQSLEQKFPPRNLLSHFDETLAAMAEIEGPEWLAYQTEENDERHRQTVAAALARTKKGKHSRTYIEGESISRWLVMQDGSVVYLDNTKSGTAETAARAKELGFEIQKGQM